MINSLVTRTELKMDLRKNNIFLKLLWKFKKLY